MEVHVVPHFNVQVLEEMLDGEVETRIIRALTDAVVRVYGDAARPLVVIELFGVPRHRWGAGGVPAPQTSAIASLNMRESALHLPAIDDPPARLIASITDALAGVFGDGVREHLNVLVIGIPAGRSGVGGEVVGV